MTLSDIKIYALNSTTLMLSLTNIDEFLKITLLIVSIGYTLQRWYLMNKDKNK